MKRALTKLDKKTERGDMRNKGGKRTTQTVKNKENWVKGLRVESQEIRNWRQKRIRVQSGSQREQPWKRLSKASLPMHYAKRFWSLSPGLMNAYWSCCEFLTFKSCRHIFLQCLHSMTWPGSSYSYPGCTTWCWFIYLFHFWPWAALGRQWGSSYAKLDHITTLVMPRSTS